MVKNSPSIQSLNLAANDIGTEGAKQLMEFEGNTKISLDKNPSIDPKGLEEFNASNNYRTVTSTLHWLSSPHTSSSTPRTLEQDSSSKQDIGSILTAYEKEDRYALAKLLMRTCANSVEIASQNAACTKK